MGKKAFTLIELLVVISIITILASLILLSLSRAKSHAQNIQCINNLRQISISISIYNSDNDCYSLFAVYKDHDISQKKLWYENLTIYNNNIKNNIFTCPSSEKLDILGINYAYNSSGCAGWNETWADLGLGGMVVPNSFTYPDHDTSVAIKTSKIKNPSEMISIGDSIIHYNFVRNYAYSGVDLSSGLWWNRYYISRKENAPYWELNTQKLINKRHLNKINIGFCDGHIEKSTYQIFDINNDENLKKWNNDNLPHQERFYPSLVLP